MVDAALPIFASKCGSSHSASQCAQSAEQKTVDKFTTLQSAGITLDSVRQEARLPDDKP